MVAMNENMLRIKAALKICAFDSLRNCGGVRNQNLQDIEEG
jgi:hypothetical protein